MNQWFSSHSISAADHLGTDETCRARVAPPSGRSVTNRFLTLESLRVDVAGTSIICDLSLEAARGEIVGLLGRDGAGKTSCFEALAGLTAAASGRILLDGLDGTEMSIDERARIGLRYLPSEVSIFRELTVEENILLALEASGADENLTTGRLEQLLEQLQLVRHRTQPARSLSGGERRRCEVARALASNPAIILLDEPFRGLDPMSISDIRDLLRDLRRQGVGVLISDNNIHDLFDLLDRAYVIDHGQLIF